MSRTIKDLTGEIFGNLKVLRPSGRNRQGNVRWQCLCVCGKEVIFSSDHLSRKTQPVKSCGCKKTRRGKESSQWKGAGEISGNWWYNHILRERKSTRAKIPVTVTVEEAWTLFLRQDGKCALSGLPLIIANKNGTASIDRIDSNRGYEIDNIQWVHKDINFMKRTYTQEYFHYLCSLVANKDHF